MAAFERARVAFRPWWPPFWHGMAGAVLGAILSLVLPQTFVSTAQVTLSSPAQGSASNSLLGLAAQFGLAGGSGQGTPDFLAALLTSEDLREAVVQDPLPSAAYAGMSGTKCPPQVSTCDLMHIWAVKAKANPRDSLEQTAKELLKAFSTDVSPATGLLTLTVRARTPLLAKMLGDRLLASADSMNLALQRQSAESQFRFLEVQLDSARDQLHAAEDALERFDLANRAGADNSPALRLERLRLQRNLTLNEAFYTQLTGTLQQVYLAAANTASSVSVTQHPNLPGRRDSPKRRVITIIAFAFGVLFWATRRYWRFLYPEVRRLVVAAFIGSSERATT